MPPIKHKNHAHVLFPKHVYSTVIFSIVSLYLKCFSLPPSCLTVDAHYERMIEAFGGKGYFVRTAAELKSSLTTALNSKDQISLINMMISPQAQRKPQVRTAYKYVYFQIVLTS